MLPLIHVVNRKIGLDNACFIVAEISANHHQNFDEAVSLIKAASKTGVDAVKFQTYTPDTITLDSDRKYFVVGGQGNPTSWKGKTLYQLYKVAYTPWEWQPKLKAIAEDLDLIFFSTPFDETAVDFLESIGVPCYKVASYDVVNIPLLKKIAKTKKPVIISVGFASLKEIELALKTLKKNGSRQIAVLHCVTTYSDNPKLEEINLKTIIDIRERFNVVSGFSDNNAGIEIPTFAAIFGASILEKHFILKRSNSSPDSRFSIEPPEMKAMVKSIRRVETAIGKVHYGPANKIEEYNKRFRPSIFASRNISKGEILNENNIKTVRPDNGLPPKFWYKVLGKKAAVDIEFATPLSRDLIKP